MDVLISKSQLVILEVFAIVSGHCFTWLAARALLIYRVSDSMHRHVVHGEAGSFRPTHHNFLPQKSHSWNPPCNNETLQLNLCEP